VTLYALDWRTGTAGTAADGGHFPECLLVRLSFAVCAVEPLIEPAIVDHLDVHSQRAHPN
jgi:hypothetical protein